MNNLKRKILLYLNENDYVSLYLINSDVEKNSKTKVCASFILSIRNYNDCSKYTLNGN